MPRRWDAYQLYVDDGLVETTTDWAFALELYRVAVRHVPDRNGAVRVVGVHGADRRTLLRRPRFP